MADRPRWWLIGVAALMAAIFLYESVGLVGAGLLVAGFAVGTVGWRVLRWRKVTGVKCLTCGEALASTARECKYCGSARWTVN
jgi:hypothetical protein